MFISSRDKRTLCLLCIIKGRTERRARSCRFASFKSNLIAAYNEITFPKECRFEDWEIMSIYARDLYANCRLPRASLFAY